MVPVIIQKPPPASVYVVVVCVHVCVCVCVCMCVCVCVCERERERERRWLCLCAVHLSVVQSVYFATQSWLFPRGSVGWGKAAVRGLGCSALVSLTRKTRHSNQGFRIRWFHDLGAVALCCGMWGSLPKCHTRRGRGWIPKLGVRPTTSWFCVGCFYHFMVFNVFRDGV